MTYVRRLIWDEWNIVHTGRHGVTPDEVEQACHGDHVQREAYAGRIMLIGATQSGQVISAVLDPEGNGVYYVVTARPASVKERRLYHSQRGGDDQ